jgi:tetratricopeptide (TPR) repeat protein
VGDGITVIILTRGNSRRLEIADAVIDILRGRPYTAPRLSLAPTLLKAIDAQGIDAAVALHETLRTSEASTYDFSEGELNGLGYTLLGRNDAAGAIRIFELNTRQYPASSNAFDSLAEAYQRGGRRAEAIAAYTHALELDPHNLNAQAMLQKLK